MALGQEERVAKRYARALFDVTAPADFERIEAQLNALAAVWQGSSDFRQGMLNPRIADAARLSIVDAIAGSLGGWVSDPIKKTVQMLVARRKASVIPAAAAVFAALVAEYKKSLALEVTLAVPVTDDVVANLKSKLSRELGGEVVLTVKSDPSLLGGATIRLGDRLLDRSVSGTLQRFASELVK
jgi:F-type H+-transporting ATPase subunit delta